MSLTIAALILFGVSVWLIIYWIRNADYRSQHKRHSNSALGHHDGNAGSASTLSDASSDAGSCGGGDGGGGGSCD
jgi:uncharacterized membrane protein YgcG